jgi:hypothetical protein
MTNLAVKNQTFQLTMAWEKEAASKSQSHASPNQMCQIDGDDDKGSDDQQSNLTLTKSSLPDAKGDDQKSNLTLTKSNLSDAYG